MPQVRYVFGPKIVGSWGVPVAAGVPADVQVAAEIRAVRDSGDSLIDMDVAFTVPPYDPTAGSRLVEVHAIAFASGQGKPTDAAEATKVSQPKASADASALIAGGEILVTLTSITAGPGTIVTVLGYLDPSPTAPIVAPVTPIPAPLEPVVAG